MNLRLDKKDVQILFPFRLGIIGTVATLEETVIS